ncbi:hypothetical protein, partial [Pseudonocardia sp. KRD291]|uniref:hypothetical protein n=1 Tax=Pseudonocardia sp. KRD291 TaxID=2792007 RepID=UPI001C4A584D
MTTTTPQAAASGTPAGMPAHLWELAMSDVRLSVPERVRNAVANGANAPEGIRRVAARVATTGAALGVPAALLAVGGFAGATTDAPVDLAGNPTPLEGGPRPDVGPSPDGGLDPAPAVPGS